MNKRQYYIGFFSVLVVSIYLIVPVSVGFTPWGWVHLDFTDHADDVWYSTNVTHPWTGTQGDYKDNIDILAGFINATDFVIEFEDTPTIENYYAYEMYIDNNSDRVTDFMIIINNIGPYLKINQTLPSYWNGTDWQTELCYLSYSINGNNLILQGIVTAISNLASARVSMYSQYTVGMAIPTQYYFDFVPAVLPSNNGIPGFAWLVALFSIFSLIGIIFVQRKAIKQF